MKKRDRILIGAVLAFGPRIMDGFTRTDTGRGAVCFGITVDKRSVRGNIRWTRIRRLRSRYEYGEIRDGKAKMIKAFDCPDHLRIKDSG